MLIALALLLPWRPSSDGFVEYSATAARATAAPSVSIVMPTHNRSRLLPHACAMVAAQTRTDLELLVLDDTPGASGAERWRALEGTEGASALGDRLRYFHRASTRRASVGRKRNLAATSLARGEFVCVWDDDDYFPPTRLEDALAPFDGSAPPDATFIRGGVVYFNAETGEFLRPEPPLAPFHPNTMVYRRRLHTQRCGYADEDYLEDAAFLRALDAAGRGRGGGTLAARSAFVRTPWVHHRHRASVVVRRGEDPILYDNGGVGENRAGLAPVSAEEVMAAMGLPRALLDEWRSMAG